MRTQSSLAPTNARPSTVITLLKDGDRVDAIIRPTPVGTHELQYLFNFRPFICRVFKRGTVQALMDSVMALKDELLGRGWRVATSA